METGIFKSEASYLLIEKWDILLKIEMLEMVCLSSLMMNTPLTCKCLVKSRSCCCAALHWWKNMEHVC